MNPILQTEITLIDAAFQCMPIPSVPAEAFSDGRHRTLWKVIQDLSMEGKPTDLATVGTRLMEEGLNDQAGGSLYYSDLVHQTPVQEKHIESHAEVLRREHDLNKVRLLCQDTLDRFDNREGISTLVQDFTSQLLDLTASQETRGRHISESMGEVLDEILERRDNPHQPLGIDTGLPGLDRCIRGFRPGELIILAAQRHVGKTCFSLDITRNALKSGYRVLYCSLEQSERELKYKLLAAESGISTARMEDVDYTQEEYEQKIKTAAEYLGSLDLVIDDRPALSDRDVIEQTRVVKPDLLVVDYIGLMSPSKKNSQRYIEVGSISASMKALAKDLQIPVILLAQLNRSPDGRPNKRPILSDIRESDQIGQDADLVIFIYRETQDNGITMSADAEIYLGKNRRGETGGTAARLTPLGTFVRAHNPKSEYDQERFER